MNLLLTLSIGDILAMSVFGLIMMVGLVSGIWTLLKQAMCEHPDYRETMACSAICTKCGKNLGFIGNIRDKNS